jgi:hypothetical protein
MPVRKKTKSSKFRARSRGLARYLFSSRAKSERNPAMDQATPLSKNPSRVLHFDSDGSFQPVAAPPAVLVATVDPIIQASMKDLLQMYPLQTLWAKNVSEVRALVAKENIAVCFCAFWLVDGTYRDVVRLLKRQPVEIPAIIVCEPACPNEYRDYLASLSIRAFDFICYPYRKTDLQRILQATFSERALSARLRSSVARGTTALKT